MKSLPLLVLALQPGGRISLKRAQAYLRSCTCNNRIYQVRCCEVTLPPERMEASACAFARAKGALEQYPAASTAIALHSYNLTLGGVTPVRMASLALVERDSLTNPFLMIESEGPDTEASLVRRALHAWALHSGSITAGVSVAAIVALRYTANETIRNLVA